MNVKRFVGKNAREAIAQARAAWGDQAVVLSNRPIPGGVEILAMAGTEVPTHEVPARLPAHAPVRAAAAQANSPAPPMSTVSFQQFVRERQRRDADASAAAATEDAQTSSQPSRPAARHPVEPGQFAAQALQGELAALNAKVPEASFKASPARPIQDMASPAPAGQSEELLEELKSMRGMISSQLANMSWFDTVRRDPVQTHALRLIISNGFSPSLSRQLVQRLPQGCSESQAGQWLLDVLAKNLHCAGQNSILEQGGVFALVGPTGVGKTTTTAKLAANFAMKHGAGSVGLITVDTYRLGASDQLRAFGRILNIPVHTARDGASLADLLNLFDKKKLVLIDTVGVGQRDRRLGELFSALPEAHVARVLVLNASSQGETLEEVVRAYGAAPGSRCVITKLDEAVKCGAIVDIAIRHKLMVEGIANGQRVPEDWHAARAQLLVQKALLRQPASVFTQDDTEMGMLVTSPLAVRRQVAGASGAAHA